LKKMRSDNKGISSLIAVLLVILLVGAGAGIAYATGVFDDEDKEKNSKNNGNDDNDSQTGNRGVLWVGSKYTIEGTGTNGDTIGTLSVEVLGISEHLILLDGLGIAPRTPSSTIHISDDIAETRLSVETINTIDGEIKVNRLDYRNTPGGNSANVGGYYCVSENGILYEWGFEEKSGDSIVCKIVSFEKKILKEVELSNMTEMTAIFGPRSMCVWGGIIAEDDTYLILEIKVWAFQVNFDNPGYLYLDKNTFLPKDGVLIGESQVNGTRTYVYEVMFRGIDVKLWIPADKSSPFVQVEIDGHVFPLTEEWKKSLEFISLI
jgi:hypothetical protein